MKTFAVLGYSNIEERYNALGTAYFINDAGYFVSAAHTFKNKDLKYFALLEEGGVEIEHVFCEYAAMENQQAPLHRDLYIGKIPDLQTPAFYRLKPSAEQYPGDVLSLSGYASREYVDIVKHGEKISIEELTDGENEDEADLPYAWKKEPKFIGLNSLALLRYSTITATYTGQNFEKLHDKLNVEGVFTNGFTISLTTMGLKPEGLSGGALVHKNCSTGIFIAAGGAISSEYVMAKLNELEIIH